MEILVSILGLMFGLLIFLSAIFVMIISIRKIKKSMRKLGKTHDRLMLQDANGIKNDIMIALLSEFLAVIFLILSIIIIIKVFVFGGDLDLICNEGYNEKLAIITGKVINLFNAAPEAVAA